MDKYGTIGLAIFIGIPLPMTAPTPGRQAPLRSAWGGVNHARQRPWSGDCSRLVTIITLLIRAGINLPIFDILIKS